MVDYVECPDGTVVAFDPGLRVSGAGAPAMAMLWVHQLTGEWPYISSDFRFDTGSYGFNYAALTQCLGEYADKEYILDNLQVGTEKIRTGNFTQGGKIRASIPDFAPSSPFLAPSSPHNPSSVENGNSNH